MREGSWTYVAMAIPVFFGLIAVELGAAWLMRRRVYRTASALADMGCGVLQQVFATFFRVLLFAGYLFLYHSLAILDLSATSLAVWIFGFLGVDCAYYWFHRTSHQVGIMWAAHVVHHQSEDYNLAVALRQGALQPFFSWMFYLPLALIGVPPLVMATCSSINTLYQFWIHTELVPRLGPFEWIFNTPSHHRVHHGRNPRYIDRNHAGTLIVWDRLFGTFEPEREPVVYGITENVDTFDPVRAHLHPWRQLMARTRRARTWADKLKVWWMPPGWEPPGADTHPARPLDAPKYDVHPSTAVQAYAVIQFMLLVPMTMAILYWRKTTEVAPRAGVAVWMALTLVAVAALLEGRGRRLEMLRLISVPGVAGLAWTAVDLPFGSGLLYGGAWAALSAAVLARVDLTRDSVHEREGRVSDSAETEPSV